MTDKTGHMDRPGVDSLNSGNILVDGIPTNHYWYLNLTTRRFEVVKINSPGTPDEVVREFVSKSAMWDWIKTEWESKGRLG